MKKTFKPVVSSMIAATLLMGALPAIAHQGWTETGTPLNEIGEVNYVTLLMGNHTNEHRSYRIDGNWGAHQLFVFSPDGQKTDITSTEFYTGENDPAVKNSKINNSYIGSFTGEQPGAYIISAQSESVNSYSGYPVKNMRNAKSFVAVADIVSAQRVQLLKGFQRIVAPDRGELVPQFNPATVKPGDDLKIQYLIKGAPAADVEVVVVRRSNKESLNLKTDPNGTVTFKAGKPDAYLVAAKQEVKEKVEGQYDAVTYEATISYWVKNNRTWLPRPKAVTTPELFVNGKQVLLKGLSYKKGKWTVSADSLKSVINTGFASKGEVELRPALEAAGYQVEWFNAVGHLPAMISITGTPVK